MSGSQQLLLGGNPQAVSVDPYFYSVTSLLHGDGTNGGQNNTFLDSSSNNFTITRNGNTTQGSFSPFSQTGWSNYFDGTGDYLRLADNAAFTLGSGNFTVECWIYNGTTGARRFIAGQSNSAGQNTSISFNLQKTSGNKLSGTVCSGSTDYPATSSADLPLNQWTHVAFVRDGNTAKLFINGIQDGTVDVTGVTVNDSSNQLAIAALGEFTGDTWNGYISNLRLVKGTAVYTSNFTPPTTPLTAITNTSLLTCQANRFLDASSNAFSITVTGDTSVQPFSPFNPTTAYSTSAVGGSGYFDGSGDYLSVTNSNDFDTNTTFTLECWIYQPAAGTGTFFSRGGGNSSNYWSTSDGYQFILYISGGTLYWQWNNAGSATSISGTAPAAGAWHHVVVGYNGTTTRLWLDGASVGTSTTAYTLPTTRNRVYIGAETAVATNLMNGYIAGLRFVQGTDVYGVGNTSISVPTAPPTAVTNTKFLANFTNGAIFDNAAVADYETVGNAQISTSVKKYGTGSMYFDGTGDWLVSPASPSWDFGSGDFTIELWINPSATTAGEALVSKGNITSLGNEVWTLEWSGTNQLAFFSGGGLGAPVVNTGSVFATGNWYHVAVCRAAGVTKIFVNGTVQGTSTTSYTITAGGALYVGAGWYAPASRDISGYIDDLRISKGVARYPYNFTPPTAEFPNIGGTVTLTADPYFDYTTLLLPGNGTNGAQNNTFLDSSTNAFSITRNGNTTQGTFSPFSQTGWGNYFDGSGDYLSVPNNAVLAYGTGDFTVEFWINRTGAVTSTDCGVIDQRNGVNGAYFMCGVDPNQQFFVYLNSAYRVGPSAATTLALGAWYHIAYVRSGTTGTLYINGTSVGSWSDNLNYATNTVLIGRHANGGSDFPGYLSNIRILKGTAQYTANFTPPTAPLTAITNTSLLTCQSNRFIDNSTNALTITPNGGVSVQAFSPFNPTAAWSAATYGGSGYFDGSGDYLSVADAAAFTLGTSDFCMESWVYPTNASTGASESILGQWSSASYGWIFQYRSNALLMYYSTNGSSTTNAINASATVVNNAWNHIAFVRSGNTLSAYVNGVRVSTNASFTASIVNSSSTVNVGRNGDNSEYVTGYLNGTRLVVGSSVYDPSQSSITVPTAPLTAVTNTSLLCNFTNAGIYDATSKNDLETVGNAQISTTQSKFGGSSMYFDGTGDYLAPIASPNVPFGTGDFTVEFWMYPTSVTSSTVAVVSNRFSAGADTVFICGFDNGTSYGIYFHTQNTAVMNTSVSPTVNTWQHVAFARYNGTLRIFLNGISIGTPTSFTSNLSATNAVLVAQDGTRSSPAGNFAGYINDLRITRGIARYTSNFTPPTTAFLTL